VIVLRQLRRGLEAPQQDGAEIPSKGSRTNTLVPWRRSLRGPAPAIVASCGERRGRCPGLSCFGPFGAAENRNFKIRKGGKTAQRNRDERAACVSPSFEQPSPAKAVVRESKVENRKLVWWDWRGWIALAWVLWWGWAYAVMAWQAKAPQVLAWLEAIKSGR